MRIKRLPYLLGKGYGDFECILAVNVGWVALTRRWSHDSAGHLKQTRGQRWVGCACPAALAYLRERARKLVQTHVHTGGGSTTPRTQRRVRTRRRARKSALRGAWSSSLRTATWGTYTLRSAEQPGERAPATRTAGCPASTPGAAVAAPGPDGGSAANRKTAHVPTFPGPPGHPSNRQRQGRRIGSVQPNMRVRARERSAVQRRRRGRLSPAPDPTTGPQPGGSVCG